MNGPSVAALVNRLAACPDDFLAPPLIGAVLVPSGARHAPLEAPAIGQAPLSSSARHAPLEASAIGQAPLSSGARHARGTVAVAGVVGDILRPSGFELPEDWRASLAPVEADAGVENWLRACLVTCWLAADPALAGLVAGPLLLGFMGDELHRMAGLVRAEKLVRDADRREELSRLLLRRAGLLGAGETPEQAADRLATLDSVTRTRVVAEAQAAEERSRQVRAALERQRAEEAAARASRE